MQHPHRVFQWTCIVLGLMVLGAAPGDASAETLRRFMTQNPTAICQSALPVYDGQIRKRPKAVQNEGTTPAFVTCSWISQGSAGENTANPVALVLYVSVNDGQADHVACVGVLGQQGQAFNTYTRGIDLHSNGGTRLLEWGPSDFGGSTTFPSGLISVSCLLNPGVGINSSQIEFMEYVGA